MKKRFFIPFSFLLILLLFIASCDFDPATLYVPVRHFTHVEKVDPTCETDGNVEYWYCDTDGKNYSDEEGKNELATIILPKLGHDMEHHAKVEATCTTDGNVEYWYCKRENKYFADAVGQSELTTIVLPKLGHDMEHHERVEATCTTDGNVEYWYCIRENKYFADAEGQTELTTIVLPKLGHDMEHHERVEATCTTDGNVEYWYCKNENKYFADANGQTELTTIVLPKLGHDMEHHERVEATCTLDGNVEYWYCKRENKYFADANGQNEITTVVLPKLGHDIEHHEKVNPTYEAEGTVEYWYCKRENKYFSDADGTNEITTIVIPKLDRNMVYHEKVEATCEADGNIEYWYCEADGKNYSDSQGQNEVTNIVIPKLGHNYKLVTKWNDKGECEYYLECENDSTHKVENIQGNISEVKKDATCEEAGEAKYTLTFTYNGVEYKDEHTIVLPAKGHKLVLVNKLEPTATEAGYNAYYKCECGKYFEDSKAQKEIADITAWKAEGGAGYLEPLGNSVTYVFTTKEFGAKADNVDGEYFEASKAGYGFEERGVQFLLTQGAITLNTTYSYNNIKKIVIIGSTAGSANANFKITVAGKTVTQSIDKARQRDVELTLVFDELVSGGVELVVTPTGGSCYIKSIQIYCESINGPIHKHTYTYSVVWKEYEPYLVATCDLCDEETEGHVVETKLDVKVEETKATCEEKGNKKYTAILPEGITNNNFELEKNEELNALGHDYDLENGKWSWNENLTSATFTITCSRCGDKVLAATVTSEVTKHATEEENGIETYTAEVVFEGVTYKNVKTKTLLYHPHVFEFVKFEWNEDYTKAYALLKCYYGIGTEDQCLKEKKVEVEFTLNNELSVAPKCEAKGKNVYNVSYENNNSTLEIEVDALNHSYGELIAEVAAACQKEGTKAHYECERCHELFIKNENDEYVKVTAEDLVIAKLPHGEKKDKNFTFVPADFKDQGTSGTGSAVSVTKDGITISTDKGYGDVQFRSYKNSNLEISTNGALIKSILFTFSGSYDGGLKTTYTDINASSYKFENLASQARITEIKVTLADQYELVHVEKADPTCQKAGNIEYWYCPSCGTKFKDSKGTETIDNVVLEKLPHNYDFDNIVWNWEQDYSKVEVVITCKDCKEEAKFVLTTETSVNGQIVEENGVYTATFIYDNKNYTDIEDTNHVHTYEFKGWTWDNDNSKATITFECSDESCKDVHTITVDSTATVTLEPSCEAKGTKVFSVEVEFEGNKYTDSKTVEVDALGHNYVIHEKVEAKAEEAGTKEYIKCESCNDTYLSYNQKETVEAAFKLTGTNTLANKTVIGKITEVKTEKNNGISVFILPLGFEKENIIECYRITNGKDLVVGDLIVVSGTIKLYNKVVEFDSGCTFVMTTKASAADLVIPAIGYEIIYKNENDLDFDGVQEEGYPQRHLVDEETALMNPTKEHYTFVGWYDNKECSGEKVTSIAKDIHEAVTLYAKWEIETFTITFKNDETVLKEITVEYGKTPSYDADEPTKAADAQYTYTFDGWDKELVAATEDATYTATFKSEVRKYTITVVVNEAEYGSVDVTKIENVSYGTEFAVDKNGILVGDATIIATPTESTKQYTYTFVEFTNVSDGDLLTGDLEITAVFARTINSYKVEFVLETGVEAIADQTVSYGEYATFKVVLKDGFEKDTDFVVTDGDDELTPTEENGNEYKVLVLDDTIIMVSGIKLHGYQITYKDEDGAFSGTHDAEYPAAHIHGQVTTLKSASKTGYTFGGWQTRSGEEGSYVYTVVTEIGADVDADVTLYAKWTINKYTITFVANDDTYGTLSTTSVEVDYDTLMDVDKNNKNTIIDVYDNVLVTATPASKTAQYTYTFVKFEGVVDSVVQDITITAVFERTVNKYTVMWINGNDELETDYDVEYGTTPTYDGEAPTKASTEQYTYTFDGWTPEVSEVIEDVIYEATFKSEIRKYTITWKNGDTVLEIDENVEYGTTPTYDGETPTKDADEYYTYTFDAWTPSISNVIGDATYTATYTATAIEYDITIVDNNKNPLNEVLGNTTVDKTKAQKDAKVTLTFTPDASQDEFVNRVASITINGVAQDTSNIEDSKYVFDMLCEAVTVEVTWGEFTGEEVTATITFGNTSGSININSSEVNGEDSKNNSVKVETKGTTAFDNNGYKIGTNASAADSITIIIDLTKSFPIKVIEAIFSGNSKTKGNVKIYVNSINDENKIGEKALDGSNEVTVKNTIEGNGSKIIIDITDIDKAVIFHGVSYTYGGFDRITYPTVTFDSKEGTDVAAIQTKAGKVIKEPANPTKQGYKFDGWYESTDNGATLANTEFDFANPITSDVTLYANWLDVNADKYTVSFDANGGELGENTDNQNIIENGKAIQPTNNPSRKGYTFDGWYKGIDAEHLEDNAFVFTTAITSNVTLYAKWTAKTYTITLDSSVQDIDSKETTATYDSSSLTSFEAHTRVGYTLDGYYLEGLQTKLINTNGTLVASINEYTNSDSKWIKDSAVTLYAKWTAIEYTIVFDENGGTGSMNSIENVKIGDALSITNRFTAPDGKEFDGWSLTSDGAVLTDTTLSLTMIAEADENTNEIKLFAIWKDETTQATYSYTLVTNISQLSTGSLIVIVHNGSKAMSTNQKSNNRGETSFDASSTTMQDNVQYITLIANGANWNLQVGENQYLNATTATSNYLRTGTTTSGVGLWSISVTSTGVATITAQDGERNLMRYNSSSKIFSCYASGQQDIQIYLVTIS